MIHLISNNALIILKWNCQMLIDFSVSPKCYMLYFAVSACDSATCLHGGTCSVTPTDPFYQCACKPQYHGHTCESE